MVRKRKKANLYSFGGGFKEGLGDLKFNTTDLGKSLGEGLVGGLGTAAGGLVGGLIGGGYESGAGNALNTIGDIGGMIPGPWGAAIGAGAKVLGGVVNAAFGTKVDQAKLNAANQGTNYLNTFTSTATSFDDVKGPDAVANVGQVYKGGLFSKGKARRKNEELRRQRSQAESFAFRSVDNIAKTQTDNMQGSFFAFGGPFDYMPVMGAIDYEIAQRRLALKEAETKKSLGGPLHSNGVDWTNGLILVDQGGTHEENPNEGVQMGVAPDGIPNLVEEGEVIWNDYVFSNRVKVPEDVKKKYKLRGSDDMTFADAARKVQKPSAERPNDLIEMRSLEDIMAKLMMEQEKVRNKKSSPQGKKYSHGGMMGLLFNGNDNGPQFLVNSDNDYLNWLNEGSPTAPVLPKLTPMQQIAKDKTAQRTDGAIVTVDSSGLGFNLIRPKSTIIEVDDRKGGTSGRHNPLTALRYAPAIGAGIGVFSDLMGWTNKPDYSNADMILDASKDIRDISYKPIGDYLTYRPLDRLFYSNILGAQAGATRRNILNTSGGNRGTAMAGLLAADYNAQNQLGNLFRQAEEYNLAQREKAATFNRATNMFNSEADLKAQIANAKNKEVKIDAAKAAASLRQAADAQSSAARNANLTNFFDSLGNIGIDAYNREDRDRLIDAGVFGTLSQRPLGWSDKRWEDYQKAVSGKGYRNGGKLRRKKGLTV